MWLGGQETLVLVYQVNQGQNLVNRDYVLVPGMQNLDYLVYLQDKIAQL